jgi:hypothetical protein
VLSRVKLSRLERIHNINGFIATIVKRTQREGCDDGEGDLGMLPRAVEKRMQALLSEVRRPAGLLACWLLLGAMGVQGLGRPPSSLLGGGLPGAAASGRLVRTTPASPA